MKKEINPIPVIVVAVLLAVVAGYFFFIRPGQVDSQTQKVWITEKAAFERHDGRKVDQTHEQFLQQLRAKEGQNRTLTQHRGDSE